MASIRFGNFIIDIAIHSIDGVFQEILGVPFRKGFWVFLTVQNEGGQKESFPWIDMDFKVKIYDSYDQAIDGVAILLKKHFR